MRIEQEADIFCGPTQDAGVSGSGQRIPRKTAARFFAVQLICSDGTSDYRLRGPERSVLKFGEMKPVRETLLGKVEAVSDAKRRA
jgi:hypothetical protein